MKSDIEPVQPKNAKEVARLWYDSWLSNDTDHEEEVTEDTLLARLQEEDWETFVQTEHGKPIAFLALDIEASTLAQLFVSPLHQNRGLGERLLEIAKQKLPHGMKLRTQTSNEGARRFYERHGFVLDRINRESATAYYTWNP